MKVSLSIVIANYNYGRYLKDAINSILSQCLPPVCVNGRNVLPVRGTDNAVELIICDAASTDDSVEIIQSYERYITWWCSEKDGGQSEAFNKGFCHSTGEWLTWLNADELLCPNVLYKFIQLVRQKKSAKWVTGNYMGFNDDNKKITSITWGPHVTAPFLKRSNAPFPVFGPTSFWRRDVYDKIGPIDESLHYAMDFEYWQRMIMAGIKPVRLNCFCWAFRVHNASKTAGVQCDALLEKRNKLVEFEKEIKDRPIIVAKVMKQVADFGLLMKYGDFTCLLPTQLATAKKEEFESLVGKELEVCPIRIDLARIRIIVSQAHAEKKKQKAARKEFISKVEVGQVYEGVVKNIEDYGAFVELYDGVEGLLHISEVDHTRVSKIEKVFKSGDTVKVQVIKVEKDHIGLSRKALLPNHWANYFADKQVGDVVTGKALEINKAGVRVQLAEELEGFVPKSEFAWDRETQIEASVNVGDEITGKLIEVEKSKRRIIVSVKQLTANPWETVQVAVGDIIDVKIAKVNEDGFKVDYQGLNGYMAKGAVKQADLEKVVLDAVVKVKVRVYDAAKQRFIVSMKDAEERVEKENYNKYIKSNDKLSNTFGDYLNDLKNKQ